MTDRVLIVFDGKNWYVRQVRAIEHDLERDERIYRCDKPLGGPFSDVQTAIDSLERNAP